MESTKSLTIDQIDNLWAVRRKLNCIESAVGSLREYTNFIEENYDPISGIIEILHEVNVFMKSLVDDKENQQKEEAQPC